MPAGPIADGQISDLRELAAGGARPRRRAARALGARTRPRGVHEIANARMTRALRSVSSEKGRDPRDSRSIAYGGAGPVHAAGLAEELGVLDRARARRSPGSSAPLGLLFARPEFHDVHTCRLDARACRPAELERCRGAAMRRARAARRRGGIEWCVSAELRYGGQSWEIEVELRRRSTADLRALIAGSRTSTSGCTACAGSRGRRSRSARCASRGSGPSSARRPAGAGRAAPTRPGRATRVVRSRRSVDVPVRTRASIGERARAGPLLIDEYDTTVVVRPGWTRAARRETDG